MDKIVAGFDGSDSARRCIDEAAQLARAAGAELHIVHVVSDSTTGTGQGMAAARVDARTDEAAAARQEGLDELAAEGLADVAAEYTDITVNAAVLHGPPGRVLTDYAGHIGADLIAVGNRRVQGISRILGSVALDVLRRADCSVYVANTT